MRLIDADSLMKKVCEGCPRNDCTPDATDTVYGCMFADSIDSMPTIEAEPVRHGRWIALEGWFNKSIVKCSVCGNTLDMDGVNAGRGDANFCPNCGARMYGGAES